MGAKAVPGAGGNGQLTDTQREVLETLVELGRKKQLFRNDANSEAASGSSCNEVATTDTITRQAILEASIHSSRTVDHALKAMAAPGFTRKVSRGVWVATSLGLAEVPSSGNSVEKDRVPQVAIGSPPSGGASCDLAATTNEPVADDFLAAIFGTGDTDR